MPAKSSNHALQRTRPSRPGCNRAPSWAGSLSLGRSASGALGLNQNPKAHPNRAGDPDGGELAPAATTDASGRNIDRHAGLGQALRIIGWLPNHRVERTATSCLVFDAVGTRNANLSSLSAWSVAVAHSGRSAARQLIFNNPYRIPMQ